MTDFEKALDEITKLLQARTPAEIQDIKDLFWKTADKDKGGRATLMNTHPEWCAAIDALPKTELLLRINIMSLEITVDIIKRALNVV
ncbi:MAG: hypothetical protein WCT08_02465 [Patescibacteria group bacterium]|jgi:hypothetical protein